MLPLGTQFIVGFAVGCTFTVQMGDIVSGGWVVGGRAKTMLPFASGNIVEAVT